MMSVLRSVGAGVVAATLLVPAVQDRGSAAAGEPVHPGSPYLQAVDLGTLGGAYSVATAVNAHQVAGYSQTASGEIHGFWWHEGQMQDLGEIGDMVLTGGAVEDMNERGDVVGTDGIHGRAVLWSRGRRVDISPPGASRAAALAVNASGHAVGFYRLPTDPSYPFVFRPFMWDGRRSFPLGGPQDTNLVARDINDRDQVVLVDDGQAVVSRWERGRREPVRDPTATVYGGGRDSINERGDVLATEFTGMELLPFIWRRPWVTYLVQPGGGGRLAGRAINARDDVIATDGISGAYWRDGLRSDIDGIPTCLDDAGRVAGTRSEGDRVHVPFVWENGTLVELPVAVPADLENASPEVTDINRRGDVVGSSYVAPGALHATVWPRNSDSAFE